jgi:hypothetical protein
MKEGARKKEVCKREEREKKRRGREEEKRQRARSLHRDVTTTTS